MRWLKIKEHAAVNCRIKLRIQCGDTNIQTNPIWDIASFGSREGSTVACNHDMIAIFIYYVNAYVFEVPVLVCIQSSEVSEGSKTLADDTPSVDKENSASGTAMDWHSDRRLAGLGPKFRRPFYDPVQAS